LKYAKQYSDVWFATREDIALAWLERDQSNHG